MRLKKFAASVICGAMLLTSGGLDSLTVQAAESEAVQENVQDVQEVEQEDVIETDEVAEQDNLAETDITEEQEEFVEQEETVEADITEESDEAEEPTDLVGLQAMEKNNEPMTAGFSFLWTNEFFKCKSVKKIKGGRTYVKTDKGDRLNGSVSYGYNDKGELINVVSNQVLANGSETLTIGYEYYDNGDLKAQYTYEDGELLMICDFEYIYDTNGNCIQENFYYTSYDDNSEEWKGKRYCFAKSYYEYDAKGKRIKETDGYYDQIIYFDYDANNNCIKKRIYNEAGKLGRVDEYNKEGFIIKETNYDANGNETGGSVNEYVYSYDADGDIIGILNKMHYINDTSGQIFERRFEFDYEPSLSTTGIYCARNYPSIQAGINIQKANPNATVEYRWVACNNNNPKKWFEISPWTKNNNWMDWTPKEYGGYVFVCYARIVGHPETEIQCSFGTEYHKYIKGICQMPYPGEGGGYLIGIESYDNPNNSYQYEMLILDCNLYMQGKDAWVYTTGRCGAKGNCLWTVWQPVYGYYWTLFRIYDSNGKLLDEACYGFENVN